MAVLTGPLFSLEAHGSLGDVITYARIGRTNYSKAHFTPANPQSDKQIRRRVMTGWLTKTWAGLSDLEKSNFNDMATSWNLSPYHAWLKWNSIRWTTDEIPNTSWPIAHSTWFTKFAFTATPNGRLWTINLTGSALFAPQLCARIQASNNPAQTWNNLKTIVILGPPTLLFGDWWRYIGTWLAPDDSTFYFGAKIGITTGALSQAIWP